MRPKVFISYSHDSEEHKSWVRKLADDLTKNGIITILDAWHLRIADDLGLFMERSIDDSDYTILICTPNFSHKANNREGGVAFETELIVGNILNNLDSKIKFIPLLREGLANESIPRYLRSKLFVDFSNDSQYEKSLKTLLRRIFDAPEYSPPNLGEIPIFSVSSEIQEVNFIPKAKILIAGTGSEKLIDNNIREISEALGKSLAENNYGLITGGWPGVDEIVARSYSKELFRKRKPIENYLTQVIVKTHLPVYTGGNLILINSGIEEWTESVSICDGIVMIHGIGGTYETAEYGVRFNKPIFPIADSGGDAKKFYIEILSKWGQYPYNKIDKLRFQRLGSISSYIIQDLIKLLDLQFSD